MKLINRILIFAIVSILSCSEKDSDDANKKNCYECDTMNDGVYRHIDCLTLEEWDLLTIKNANQEVVDKATKCRTH